MSEHASGDIGGEPANILDLRNRVALVTGAGQGIGRSIALTLASHGGRIVVNDVDAARAKAVAEEIRADGRAAKSVTCDVSDFGRVVAMVAEAEQAFGQVDMLINNAGNAGATMDLGEWQPFWETGPAEWQHWLGVNLYGVLNCCRAVLPGMKARGFGRLLTISSDAGRVGEPHFAVYSCAKAGAAGLMRALAKAGGRYGITANTVALGGVDTPGAKSILVDEAAVKAMLRHYVIRRVGQPSGAAYMVLFLASDAASWITGQTYPVNGGYSFSM
jgi:3-oxoacyl-[acyl-carrier protein] reductase